MKKVLIISNPQDKHTECVVAKIQKLGAEPLLFYPEKLGQNFSITLTHFADERVFTPILFTREIESNFSDFYSVWFRRPRLVTFELEEISHEGIEFVRDEWRALLEAIYALMKTSLWVSHPDRLREAARKPVQMLIANELGLRTPHTLITNDSSKAKEFFQAYKGKVICKPTGSGWTYSQDGKSVKYVLTNRMCPNDFEADEEIRMAPVTFQEEIPKAYEVRVNIIGQEVLAIKIDSQRSEISQLDWRRYDVDKTPYSAYQLPIEIKSKCLKLTQMLGLEFGAIDLIRTPDGNYIFLEINGNGQFLWAEELSGVKVSDSLAYLLAGIAPPLKSANLA
jgi:glutathione synthase/RimK-type ligase-like ATP-grasp enzyme